MRKGSLEYWPHRRAIKQMPRVRSTPVVNEASLLSFAAFKVGMTHVMMTDDSESPAKGTEVARAVTVLEIPRIFVYGARFYKNSYSSYKTVAGEAYDMALAANVGIKKAKKNDINAFKNDLANMIDVTMLAYLDPENLGFANKKIMRFEIHVGGKNATERFGFIESHIGKELKVANFIKAGDYIDVSSISKGKGWAGVIKRFGVSRQYRKATGKVRHVGTLGAWHPPKVLFGVPHSGHKGYNYRTEINKRVLKVGTPQEAAAINVKGGYVRYGLIKNDYLVVDGTIPGSPKRLVRLRKALRPTAGGKPPVVSYISLASKQ